MVEPTPVVTDEHIEAYIAEALADDPRRFALFGLTADHSDVGLVGWGLDFGDGAIFVTCDSAVVRSASADSVRRMFSLRGEVRLTWLDPAPSDPDGTGLREAGSPA